jgi:sugar lactone lactonase YvrE
VSDFITRKISRVSPAGAVTNVAQAPARPSGLGFTPDGQLLVSLMESRTVAEVDDDGSVIPYADLNATALGVCNDMLVDGTGRAYVGGMGFDVFRGDRPSPGNLVLVDADRSAIVVATDLHVPNGMVIDTAGRLIVAETNAKRLTSFTVANDGTLSNRAVYADLGDYGPDGTCIDVADGIWVAACFNEAFVYVTPDGGIAETIATPGRWAVACALGGADGHTLFMLTAETTMRSFRHGESKGRIEVAKVETPGRF